jgi:hypothetical protein
LNVQKTGVLVGMKITRTLQAKIVQHAEGLGVPTPDTVRRRALEIARIDGRSEHNETDWRQAKQELHGGHNFSSDDGEEEMSGSVSERDMVAGSLGHQAEVHGLDDAHSIVEELVAEGMDEAVHDQMLAASRSEPIDESDAED